MRKDVALFTAKTTILKEESVMDVMKVLCNKGQEDAFYVLDVGDIVMKIKLWRLKMPRVEPFYAVKCNNDPTVLETLAMMGVGFDCASKNEIGKVLGMGVDPTRIIYAHPCKPSSHIRHAAKSQVRLMTFDNEAELRKIRDLFPDAQLVIRIRCDAAKAQCDLGIKYGVIPAEAPRLLQKAYDLGLNVVGVSFHVGSGCEDPPIFYQAISAAREIFEVAKELGFNPTLLDIGGGFPGDRNKTLDELAFYINKGLDEFFPEGCGVRVIAEPGRYVVASAFTLATTIVSKRDVYDGGNKHVSTMYYINDGVYGSFNCVLFDHQEVSPMVLKDGPHKNLLPCSVWGPTCDGLDKVTSATELPLLEIGDWLVCQNMGAYTLSAANTFNGFPLAGVHAVIPTHSWMYLEELVSNEDSENIEQEEKSSKDDRTIYYPCAVNEGVVN